MPLAMGFDTVCSHIRSCLFHYSLGKLFKMLIARSAVSFVNFSDATCLHYFTHSSHESRSSGRDLVTSQPFRHENTRHKASSIRPMRRTGPLAPCTTGWFSPTSDCSGLLLSDAAIGEHIYKRSALDALDALVGAVDPYSLTFNTTH